MPSAFAFFLTVCSAIPLLAAQGIVSTVDGRKLEGVIEFGQGALQVKTTEGEVTTVAADNIARAQLSTNIAAALKGRGNGLLGAYYSTSNFTGAAMMRLDEAINFSWKQSPAAGLPHDFFSVRWMGYLEAPTTEQYTIHLGADEGGRLFLDEKLIAENADRTGYTETNVSLNFSAGEKRKLKVEYFDTIGNAQAKLFWSTATMPKAIVPRDRVYAASFDPEHVAEINSGAGLLVTYYNGDDFNSNSFTRVDPAIDFDWKGAAPAPGIAGNHFSVRWTGSLRVTNSGEYQFRIQAGAPSRLFINEKLVSDPWTTVPEQVVATVLRAGERCELRLELRVTNALPPVKLSWNGPGFSKTLLAREHLSPAHAPLDGSPTSEGHVSPAGIVLVSGAIIDAPIRSASDSSIHLKGVFEKQTVPLAKVARLHVKPLTAEFASAIPKGRTGVLLKNRDFIDGDFAGIENGRVKIVSVLFGNRTFNLAKEVVAVVLRGNEPRPWRWLVAARDGTLVYGKSLSIAPARVNLSDAPEFALTPEQVAEVSRRSEADAGR
jgi:hypothetical protein